MLYAAGPGAEPNDVLCRFHAPKTPRCDPSTDYYLFISKPA